MVLKKTGFFEGDFPEAQKIRPVIKWTGGKYNEYPLFSSYIPSFNRYFEPFFGGGGVFFAMMHKAESFLNDKSKNLIKFYSLVNSKEFEKELLNYAVAWDEAGSLAVEAIEFLVPFFTAYLYNQIDLPKLEAQVKRKIIALATSNNHKVLLGKSFIIYPDAFIKKLVHSITDKCRRIKNICIKQERIFNETELAEHIETGIKSGLFLFLRGLMNEEAAGKLVMSKEKTTANWYFVREFCYASMFRYNRHGGFNIPYGGIAYNRKNFRIKVENIFSNDFKELMKNSRFYNEDFADFLLETKPGKDDFVFLDPPYDSEFSEYDQNTFTKQDQVRLRNTLFNLEAKWMVVIKETEFIRELYTSPLCTLIQFDKTYTYNVRGRNNRDTKHLIIINYRI